MFQADPQKNLLCILPAPLPSVHAPTPTTSFPTEAPLRVSEAGGQTVLAYILVCPVSCITGQVT